MKRWQKNGLFSPKSERQLVGILIKSSLSADAMNVNNMGESLLHRIPSSHPPTHPILSLGQDYESETEESNLRI